MQRGGAQGKGRAWGKKQVSASALSRGPERPGSLCLGFGESDNIVESWLVLQGDGRAFKQAGITKTAQEVERVQG